MKKALYIIFLITIITFCGCTYQDTAKNASSSESVAKETESSAPITTITPTIPTSTIIATSSVNIITPTAPIYTVTPNAQATFTLTKADYNKLKSPLTVLAIANEYSPDLDYDIKNGLTKENIDNYVILIADCFDYFYPINTIEYVEKDNKAYYETDNQKYGVKKGDVYFAEGKNYIPQKVINLILLSTFGEEALKKYNLNENIFDGMDYRPDLVNGIYIFSLGDPGFDYGNLGKLNLPVKGNGDTEFKTNYKITYYDDPADNFSVTFKLRKDDSSEWGYNITAFNMQKVE
jgi:hypothetical protein